MPIPLRSEVPYLMRRSTTRRKNILRTLTALIFWIAVWHIAAAAVGQELVLPTPLSVLKTLALLVVQKSFWHAAGMSLLRIFCGCVAGTAVGAVLATLTAWNAMADAIITPVLRVIRATPVASFIILALLWLGKGLVPAFTAALMVVPVVWGALLAAIRSTDRDLLEMAHAYRFGALSTLKLVYIPSVMPAFSAACITALGLAWKAGIAAEVLCRAKNAIGSELYYSKIYLETPALFAWTAVVIILSFVFEKLIASLIAAGKRRSGL